MVHASYYLNENVMLVNGRCNYRRQTGCGLFVCLCEHNLVALMLRDTAFGLTGNLRSTKSCVLKSSRRWSGLIVRKIAGVETR